MRIVCVGGGPAGLYFSILVKQADPEHEVVVYERNAHEAAIGWGVVFWDDLLDDLRATDPETARRIADAAVEWHGQVVVLDGQASESEAFGYSIVRSTLLNILVERAAEVGVRIEFDREISSVEELTDADVIVACDGANSALRRLGAPHYSTDVAIGRNKYLWLGTAKVFDAFTFLYVKSHAGWIWCHAYAIDECTSTFIVECTTETWAGLGFDVLTARDGIPLLEELFAAELEGERLRSRSPDDAVLPWLNFRTITNEHWFAGNTVLMGDAAHTTSFSIGSGTRLGVGGRDGARGGAARATTTHGRPSPRTSTRAAPRCVSRRPTPVAVHGGSRTSLATTISRPRDSSSCSGIDAIPSSTRCRPRSTPAPTSWWTGSDRCARCAAG